MNTLIPGAPLRSLSPTTNEYQRAQGESRAAKPARAARFTLDAPEHSGTIPGARGDILTPGVALTSNLAVIFTLNQHIWKPLDNRESLRKDRKRDDFGELFRLFNPPETAWVSISESRVKEVERPLRRFVTQV